MVLTLPDRSLWSHCRPAHELESRRCHLLDVRLGVDMRRQVQSVTNALETQKHRGSNEGRGTKATVAEEMNGFLQMAC